jgi:hypothetical protein
MNELESRLAELLHRGAPEPRRSFSASEIAALAAAERAGGRSRTAQRTRRWVMPTLAAAGVLAAVAIPIAVIGLRDGSGPSQPGLGSSSSLSERPSAPDSSPTLTTPNPETSRPVVPPSSGAGTPSTSVATSPSTTGSSPSATCPSSQLRLSYGQASGAAGSLFTPFYLTNLGPAACVTQGFPGVSLLDATGAIVGAPATREGAEGGPVHLASGGRARFVVRVGTAPRTGCGLPRPSTQIQVYPPDQTVALRLAFPTGSCALTVQTVTSAP